MIEPPFAIHVGDVFGAKKGKDTRLRVITGLGIGTIAVRTAIPDLTPEGVEYFSVFGSTHLITEVQPVLERWSIDRIILAHRKGMELRYRELPEANREQLIEDFALEINKGEIGRVVTLDEIVQAVAYEERRGKG